MSRETDKEQLLDEVSAFTRKLRAFFDARVGESGLTLARARALFALSRRGPLTQTELAEEMEIETPTLVRVLDGMEKQNLIERRSDENDRRAKRIHMTAEGEKTSQTVQAVAKSLRSKSLPIFPRRNSQWRLMSCAGFPPICKIWQAGGCNREHRVAADNG